jgi:hypothetical protein
VLAAIKKKVAFGRKQGLGTGKGRWQEIKDSGLSSARDETSCGSGCRMVARGSSYQYEHQLSNLSAPAEFMGLELKLSWSKECPYYSFSSAQ